MIDQTLFEELVSIRRDLHRFPEVAFDVHRTAKIAADEMEKLGLKVRRGVGITGVIADLEVAGATEWMAFRADMDALPMNEENDLPYRSEVEGKAHMCGHDGHTSILIGTAKFLMQEKHKLKRNIRFIFQPSEEQKPGGAPGMIKDGCLEGVSAIYGLHVWPWLPCGQIGICPREMLAQSDVIDITIKGKGGHAAAPHETVDPIVIGAHLVTMLQTLVSRMTNPLDPAVISITRFQGGSAYNVIPSEVSLAGTVRTYNPACLAKIKAVLQQLIDNTANAFGAHITLQYTDGYPPLINHENSCQQAAKAAAVFLNRNDVIFPAQKAMFGEDFAYYLQKIPGCFIQLGCRNEEKKCIYPLHHPQFNLDEECIKIGVRLFATLATSS